MMINQIICTDQAACQIQKLIAASQKNAFMFIFCTEQDPIFQKNQKAIFYKKEIYLPKQYPWIVIFYIKGRKKCLHNAASSLTYKTR